MDWIFSKSPRYFATCAEGVEELVAAELTGLDAAEVSPSFRGVFFTAPTPEVLYGVNYRSRLATRVLAPLMDFGCHDTKYLYLRTREADWPSLFPVEKTFAVTCNVSDSHIRHSQYAALCLKDAIVDNFRDRCGRRPDVERLAPDVSIDLHIHRNRAFVSLDTSGGSLHRRGYRAEGLSAPLQETVAASILVMAGWKGETPLVDPMCGSGTILAEALMLACDIPAGYLREHWGFENMPGFDAGAWRRLRATVDGCIRELPAGLLSGGDASSRAVTAARRNLSSLPGGGVVRIETVRFQDREPVEGVTIVTNPPYGIRLGERAEAEGLAGELGDFLKQKCKGSKAYVYLGDRNLLKHIGLRPAWRKPLMNGPLDGRLALYELY
jgi:putative N6-adenine-specific DNA methylase